MKYVLADSYKYVIAATIMGCVILFGMRFVDSMILQVIFLIPLGAIVYFLVLAIINRDVLLGILKKK